MDPDLRAMLGEIDLHLCGILGTLEALHDAVRPLLEPVVSVDAPSSSPPPKADPPATARPPAA